MRFKGKIPNITNLGTTTALTAVENKIPNASNLVKKNWLQQANSASTNYISNFIKKTDFDNKLKDFKLNKNELNKLSKKVQTVSTKESTKDLINKFRKYIKYFSGTIFISLFLELKWVHFCMLIIREKIS